MEKTDDEKVGTDEVTDNGTSGGATEEKVVACQVVKESEPAKENSTSTSEPAQETSTSSTETAKEPMDTKDEGSKTDEKSTTVKNGNVSKSNCPRTTAQPTKRRPDKDLNHDNWDEEEEPEEKGEFVKASTEQMKDRKVLTARRKQKPAGTGSASNPFGGIALGSTPFGGFNFGATAAAPKFNFGTTVPAAEAPIAAPKFDFSSLTNTKADLEKKAEVKAPETPSSKKLKTSDAESAPPVIEATGNNSATTV